MFWRALIAGVLPAVACVAWTVLAAMQPVQAQQTGGFVPSPDRGRALSLKLCATCHFIDEKRTGTTNPSVPSFLAIANRPGQTGDHIINILIQPHGEMPDVQLTRAEINDLLAYFERLRLPGLNKPLLPPVKPQTPRPKLPQAG